MRTGSPVRFGHDCQTTIRADSQGVPVVAFYWAMSLIGQIRLGLIK
jgi:hypothetical protein